jgi:hypothetical protein
MGCRPPGTDDPSRFFSRHRIQPGFGMHDEQNDIANQANCLPSIAVGMRIWTTERERIVKYQPGRAETQTVITPVRAVLFLGPDPTRMVPFRMWLQ